MQTPRTIQDARRQANTFAKALQMTTDGYRFLQYGKTPVFAIFKPENDAQTTGRGDYNINRTPGIETCDCSDFVKHGEYCKHTLWLDGELKKQAAAQEADMWAAICAEYDLRAQYENVD